MDEMPAHVSTKYNKVHTFRKNNRFVYEWFLDDFKCEANSPSTCPAAVNLDFDSSNGMFFKGKFYVGSNTCPNLNFHIALERTPIQNWELKCIFSCGEFQSVKPLTNTNREISFPLARAGKCLLKENNYTVKFEILHDFYVTTYNIRTSLPDLKEFNSEMIQNVAELFKSKEFSDVILEVEGHELPAYKGILATQSKVFAAMFKHDTIEARSNRVVIEDTEHIVFEEMLRYMYTGKVPNLKELAWKLLPVSDKYNLENLKNICAHELLTQISADTAASILIAADLYGLKKLKQNSVNFINNHREAVITTEGWKDIQENHVHLLVELYAKINK